MLKYAFTALPFLLISTQAQGATITYFSGYESFLAAMDAPAFEDFNDRTLIPGLSLSANIQFTGSLITHTASPTSTAIFSFAEGITGFSGRYSIGPTVTGGGLRVDVVFADDSEMRLDDIVSGGGDYAFTSDMLIKSIKFGSRLGKTENWDMLDLTAGTAKIVTAVPEPKSWAMMIFGLLAVGSALRRRPTLTPAR